MIENRVLTYNQQENGIKWVYGQRLRIRSKRRKPPARDKGDVDLFDPIVKLHPPTVTVLSSIIDPFQVQI
jgi:hypothetical protein